MPDTLTIDQVTTPEVPEHIVLREFIDREVIGLGFLDEFSQKLGSESGVPLGKFHDGLSGGFGRHGLSFSFLGQPIPDLSENTLVFFAEAGSLLNLVR